MDDNIADEDFPYPDVTKRAQQKERNDFYFKIRLGGGLWKTSDE